MSHHTSHSLNSIAFSSTVHCLTGCAIGEVAGMVLGTALMWSNFATVVISIVLAFVFGYALSIRPLLADGVAFGTAVWLAFAADTLSIATMELVDNAVMVFIPGAMNAQLTDLLFWGSLAISLILAGLAAFPVNRWLLSRNQGHAVIHEYMGHAHH